MRLRVLIQPVPVWIGLLVAVLVLVFLGILIGMLVPVFVWNEVVSS